MDLDSLQGMRSSWIRNQTHVSCIGWCLLYTWITREAQLQVFYDAFYQIEEIPFSSLIAECSYHKSVLHAVKYFICVYGNHHVEFILYYINMACYFSKSAIATYHTSLADVKIHLPNNIICSEIWTYFIFIGDTTVSTMYGSMYWLTFWKLKQTWIIVFLG